MPHQLDAIADAEHRHAQVKDGRIGQGGLRRVDRRGATGEDDAFDAQFLDLRGWCVIAQNGRVNVQFTDPACNDLRILGSEIEDDDLLHEQR